MKQVLISCGVIVVLCLVIIGIYEKQNHNISQNTTGGGYANEISASEIAQHSTPSDCWTAVGSNVYDFSDYFNQNSTINTSDICGHVISSSMLPSTMKLKDLTSYSIGLLTP